MENSSILIIDDEVEIADLVEAFLVNEGYKVYKAYTGSDGLNILRNTEIHLVILDIMLPGTDGFEVCRTIRSELSLPIIMLSAKSRDMDKILGLGTGADDYMVKPFNPMELVARVKSQLRRFLQLNLPHEAANNESVISIKGIIINKLNHTVMMFDKVLELTPTEYDILLLLAENPGRVFSREEIFERVWKEKYFESNNTVMVHIWRLREKLGENPKNPEIIETVWGVGYKIEK